MRVIAKVVRWGDSLVVRLPDGVGEALNLREDDEVELGADTQTRQVVVCKSDKMAHLRAFRGRLPIGFQFKRDEANGRG